MASSSTQRRKPLRKRQPLAHSNSSIFGAIKNLVTAPLAWFTNADDFEDSKESKGKRRRLAAAPTEPNIEEDDRTTRIKRMRMHSPPREFQHSRQPPSENAYGYLDPPSFAFQKPYYQSFQSNQLTPTRSTSVSIPVSISQPVSLPRNNNSFIRANTLSRTMSVDPPVRSLSSTALDLTPLSVHDASMEISTKTTMRDLSAPPLSARTSFRMRTSMTPQPQPHREVSEPPPLDTLLSNPTFVRAPPLQVADSVRELSRQPSITLGSLVDSVRRTQSPVRQHRSLFGSNVEHTRSTPHPESTIEKALHELDIYKTPLVPTRLRTSNVPASSTSSDLFKSRRVSHLVLMQDDRRTNRLGKGVGKKQEPMINETKPYAGEGGMKKFLARRKQEVEEQHGDPKTKDDNSASERERERQANMDNDHYTSDRKMNEITSDHSTIPPSLPPLSNTDWTSSITGSSTKSTTTSSLRVGRTRGRSHIVRPVARPMKTKFSAAYDDDDAMDDIEGEPNYDERERKKEQEMMADAAQRVPLFEIPEGFTFAKTNPPRDHDSINVKEPPIASLPFSFAKSSTAANTPSASQQISSPVLSTKTPVSTTLSAIDNANRPTSPVLRVPSPIPLLPHQPTLANSPAPVSGNGMPNFFASSPAFVKPLNVPQPLPLAFPPESKNLSTLPPAILESIPPNGPIKDLKNPLWEGENQRDSAIAAPKTSTLFTGFEEAANINRIPAIPFTPPGDSSISTVPARSDPTPSVSISVLGANAMKDGEALSTPRTLFDKYTPSLTLSEAAENVTSASIGDNTSASGPLSGNLVAPTISSISNISKPLELFEHDPPKTLVPTSPSTTQDTTKPSIGDTTIPVETAKSMFDGTFSFGKSCNTNKEAEQKPMPFSSEAPPQFVDNKNNIFPFGPAPTTPVPPPSTTSVFSFTGRESNVGDVANSLFSFNQPTAMVSADRPSTPPKIQEQEVSMEESPTRDLQQSNKASETSTLGSGGFSFTSAISGATFGVNQTNNPSTAFSFGTSPTSTNPFTKVTKPENKPFGGGFGQTIGSSTSFGFGQNQPINSEPPKAVSTGSFFSPTSSSATGPSTFVFGGSGGNNTANIFGQSGSTPSSPSTFNQPSPFSFSTPLPPVSNVFSFGLSQPASPAGGNTNLNLSQPPASGGFSGGGGFGQTQPSSSFGSAGSTGGTLFTMGAAPTPTPGGRQIRKLPNRRGGAKR